MGYGIVTRSVHFRVRERRCRVGPASKMAAGNAVGMESHSILGAQPLGCKHAKINGAYCMSMSSMHEGTRARLLTTEMHSSCGGICHKYESTTTIKKSWAGRACSAMVVSG